MMAGQRILHEVATLGEEGGATERHYGLEPVDPSVSRLLSLASAAETGAGTQPRLRQNLKFQTHEVAHGIPPGAPDAPLLHLRAPEPTPAWPYSPPPFSRSLQQRFVRQPQRRCSCIAPARPPRSNMRSGKKVQAEKPKSATTPPHHSRRHNNTHLFRQTLAPLQQHPRESGIHQIAPPLPNVALPTTALARIACT
jgi:hypothetical protein